MNLTDLKACLSIFDLLFIDKTGIFVQKLKR